MYLTPDPSSSPTSPPAATPPVVPNMYADTPSAPQRKLPAGKSCGHNYSLTMSTIFKKTTPTTSIGRMPMMRFLETHVPDLYNSEYKDLLRRNSDRAEAVLRVQRRYWEGERENAKPQRRKGVGKVRGRERKEGIGKYARNPPEKLDRIETATDKTKGPKRTRGNKALYHEEWVEQQRSEVAEALAAPGSSNAASKLAGDEVEPPAQLRTALPTPEHGCVEGPGPILRMPVNRDPRCIVEARTYLEILVRNARDDHCTTRSSPSTASDTSDFSTTETDIYSPSDSAVLLRLRTHPLNTSNAYEIINDIAENEAIMRAGYRGDGVFKVARGYEEGRKRLVRELVRVVEWDGGLRGREEEQAMRLVDQVLRWR
ncbi:hypothetical protein K458DRAFT_467734 [Lentithecium fluviatile CBS 122367]|uniref:Uncharacterized protein n=1 Tax=Lentithecium fluviatile CBS 122367 TaxID=1168545 RepID=A0A6G1JC54_9PLEO|nr:hypothetical protein K458DRAFT_467734 [Lentithecium fluviatile CBS 122367]